MMLTKNDADKIKDLVAKDFEITGNHPSNHFNPENDQAWGEYEDDGITLSVKNNVLTMNVKHFTYNEKWKVTCTTNEELTFDKDNVTTVKTLTLDDVKRGKFTYAGITREYALYMPKNAKNVPLVIWNHGGGEYAIDLETNLTKNRGVTAWPEAGYKTAVLMIQVSNPNYSYGAADSVSKRKLIDQNNALQVALVKQLIKEGKVDSKRVYVTGASSGGGATMRMLLQNPELFAGAIACCSMDPIVTVHNQSFQALKKEKDSFDNIVDDFVDAFQDTVYTYDTTKKKMVSKKIDTKALVNVPIFFTHAQNDPTCSVDSSKAMYKAFEKLGDKNNKIVIWSNDDLKAEELSPNVYGGALLHWSWVKIFNHNEPGTPMNWLFKQVKPTPAPAKKPAPKKPAKVSLKSVKAGKKSLKATWKKAKDAKTDQIAYKKKGAKKFTYTTTKNLSKTISKLTKKKYYSVKVRGVNGKVYGAWSATKTVKVK